MQAIQDLWRGIIEQPKKLAIHSFASFSMVFTIVKAITHYADTIEPKPERP